MSRAIVSAARIDCFGLCQVCRCFDECPATVHAIILSPKFMRTKAAMTAKAASVRSGQPQFAKGGPRPPPVTPRLHRHGEFVGAAKGGKQQRNGERCDGPHPEP